MTDPVFELNLQGITVVVVEAITEVEYPWPERLGAWRWRCRYVDGPYGEHSAWHYDKDDQGWGATLPDAQAAALAHVRVHADAGRLPPPARGKWAYHLRHRAARALRRRPVV